MPVEEIIKELGEQGRIIDEALKKREELIGQLVEAKDESWDLMSVQKASEKSGLSAAMIYRLINSGKISCVHKGARKYVSSRQLESLDDKYVEHK